VPFPDPDERPKEERNLKLEFGVLLVLTLILLIASIRATWNWLAALL
jgi:hypothetical protein